VQSIRTRRFAGLALRTFGKSGPGGRSSGISERMCAVWRVCLRHGASFHVIFAYYFDRVGEKGLEL